MSSARSKSIPTNMWREWFDSSSRSSASSAAPGRSFFGCAADIKMPVVLRNIQIYKLSWKAPAYHTVIQILHNPLYAGAYAFGRIAQKTRIVDGRARKVSGFKKPREEWNVLLHDNHPGYISWQEYEDNQRLLLENSHMKKNCSRKSARGGRALLTGLMRCGRCGRMMRVLWPGQGECPSFSMPRR